MQTDWDGQKVIIIGAARQGLALARFLSGRGARVILNDQRSLEGLRAASPRAIESLEGLAVQWALGGHPLEILEGASLVCVSGGVPLELPILIEARRRGLPLTNDSQIFMQSTPAPVIGITGSAGKTTTTTLVGRMAQAHAAQQGLKAWIGGNIGLPLVDYLDQIDPRDPVILELSSFQLELMTVSPQTAAILNITPNHLDRHGTMEAYTAAKARILEFQSPGDSAVLSREDPGAWNLRGAVKGRLVSFGRQRGLPSPSPSWEKGPGDEGLQTYTRDQAVLFFDGQQEHELMPVTSIGLRGGHNLLNVLAACATGLAAGFSLESVRSGVEGFHGVAHRLEWVRQWHGVNWYNDSIATAPERTIAAIQAFDEPLVLLLGGRDKNLPWEKLAALLRQRVEHVVVFGEAAPKILDAIGTPPLSGGRPRTIQVCQGLRQAVQAAASVVQSGDVVLLSPGGTSFDEFKDFEERGERFREWVKELS